MLSPLVLSAFGLVFVAELPDKTALASLVLATRYPARQVIGGAWLAFLVQTMVAVLAGSLLQLLPATPVRVAAGLGFLVFAIIAARRPVEDEDEAVAREEAEVDASLAAAASAGAASKASSRPPWLMCFVVVFAAEWGDLTQLATAALVAQTGQPIPVAIGATTALWSVTLLAVVAGSQLSRFLRPRLLKWISVAVFAFVGVVVLISAIEPL